MRAMNLSTLARHLELAAKRSATARNPGERAFFHGAGPVARESAAELILILSSGGDGTSRDLDEPTPDEDGEALAKR
jgi:hypothetical protein